jgi:hypothetical protein
MVITVGKTIAVTFALVMILDVEHNAIVADPQHPENLYVGADIGVWHSPDKGRKLGPAVQWSPGQCLTCRFIRLRACCRPLLTAVGCTKCRSNMVANLMSMNI